MAVLYSEPPQGAPLPEPLPHKAWTREELVLVESTRVLEGTHYELIEGELIDKRGKKFPHVRSTFAMAKALRAIFGEDCVITEAPINVAASSLAQDLSTKAKLYARAGIPEYWVLDVDNRRLYLHRAPAAGLYQFLTEIDATRRRRTSRAPQPTHPAHRASSERVRPVLSGAPPTPCPSNPSSASLHGEGA